MISKRIRTNRLMQLWSTSLKWRIIFIFVPLISLNMAVIGVFVDYQVKQAIDEDAVRLSQLVVRQSNLNISNYISGYERFLFRVTASSELHSWSFHSKQDRNKSVIAYKQLLDGYIFPFHNEHPELLSLSLYSKYGNEIHHTKDLGIHPTYSMSEEPWMEIYPAIRDPIIYYVHESSQYVDARMQTVPTHVISLIKHFDESTYIKIDLRPTLLESIIDEIQLGDHATGFIVNEDNLIIAHPDQKLLFKQADVVYQDLQFLQSYGSMTLPDDELTIYETIPNTNWKLVMMIPTDNIAGNINHIWSIFLISTLICMIISILAIYVISSSITRRLKELVGKMVYVKKGNLRHMVEVQGNDEVSRLSEHYNMMLSSIQEHIEHSIQAKLAEQRAVLLSLQSQIDSHFLYNTLEIINSMATRIRHKEIEGVTVALSRLLRYTADYREIEVSVREEITHLENYLRIIKVRFRDQFSYELLIDENCLDLTCLKVLLQPLAENAVKHAVEKYKKPLHFSLEIRLEDADNVVVIAKDDGSGFSEEALSKVNEGDGSHYSPTNKIGLLNMTYRLFTRYAGKGTLVARNALDGGAEVWIRYPVREYD